MTSWRIGLKHIVIDLIGACKNNSFSCVTGFFDWEWVGEASIYWHEV